MSTIRAVNEQDERLATGRTLKDGSFLQFYPRRQPFASEDVWRHTLQAADPTIAFTTSGHVDKPDPADKRRQARLEATIMAFFKERSAVTTVGKEWKYEQVFRHSFPAGTYYVGDLCYALPYDIYDGVFGIEGYKGGLYTAGNATFLVDCTAFGDGEYKDTLGRCYSVDAGIIGICTETLIDKDSKSLRGGHILTFHEPFHCRFFKGVFEFTSHDGWRLFKIDTLNGAEEGEDSE